MRTLKRNEIPMRYALLLGETEIPDYYTDEEGNRYPTGVTGEYEAVYSSPAEMTANMSMSGGDAEEREYGLSIDQYEAVLVYEKDIYPLEVGTPIWVASPIRYEESAEEKEIEVEVREVGEDGKPKKEKKMFMTNKPQPDSADYTVIKLVESLYFTKAILKAVNK